MIEETKPKKVRGRPFPKGVAQQPKGRPPAPPDLKEAFHLARKSTRLTQILFENMVNNTLFASADELDDVLGSKLSTNIERLIASIVRHAVVDGDEKRLNFILDRLLGKQDMKIRVDAEDATLENVKAMTEKIKALVELKGGFDEFVKRDASESSDSSSSDERSFKGLLPK